MTAYIIVDIDVSDAERYERYRNLAPAAIAAYGGRYLVRGGETVPLEGGWTPSRVVLLEFPTLEAARTFYDSPEYREARAAREGAARMRMVAAQGL